MKKQPKLVISFGISFFASFIIIIILYGTKILGIEVLYGGLITLPFTIVFIWIFSKQVDIILYSATNNRKRLTGFLFFIIRIIVIVIPSLTFGVLRLNDIWYDAFWGAFAVTASLPIGFGILTLLTSKERMQANEIMQDYYFNSPKNSNEEEKPSKRAQKFLDKIKTDEGGD